VPPPVVKRADSQRNRATILATAEAMFAKDGLAVSVDHIAKRAGVGIGTLYRHFPTKDALVAAIVVLRIERVALHSETLLADRDPGAALFGLIERLVEEGVQKRDFVDALGSSEWFETPAMDQVRQRFRRALGKLLALAQDQGAVRADVQASDLLALVRGVFGGADAKTRKRLFGVVFDGLRVKPPRR
jgi:AcrR family transcriptional regulator